MTTLRAILTAAWGGLLFLIGLGAGLIVAFVLYSVAALVAGYERGKEL